MSDLKVSHFGMCISDLDKTLRFYCDGLGFEEGVTFDIGNEFGKTLEVEGDVSLMSKFIARDGFSIELLHYQSPAPTGTPSQTRGQLGVTHLSLNVDDFDAVKARLTECGGEFLEHTYTEVPNADGTFLRLGFFADPDGNRVELMENAPATS